MLTPPSLEQEIKDFFAQHKVDYDDRSRSFTRLDFGYGDEFTNRYVAFDAKEKRQRYNPHNWPTAIPEEHLFIIDDLAARKILLHAPNAGLLVRDTSQETPAYYFYSVAYLFHAQTAGEPGHSLPAQEHGDGCGRRIEGQVVDRSAHANATRITAHCNIKLVSGSGEHFQMHSF